MTPERWARAKSVFHEALERDPGVRPSFVMTACGEDAELRAEVERLLAAHGAAGDFIESTPVSLTGRHIGRYHVGPYLGVGGMGEVYLARDTELGRNVALKIGISNDGDMRLRREAQCASQLNHPNICTIHEIAVFDGRPYIVMEYVDGQPLSALISAGTPNIDKVVDYGVQISAAVAHAHAHGVIHRDLKTTNIMVTPDGRAKVLDFGLARRLAPRADGAPAAGESNTGELQVAGTLSYMAPEVLRGERADARGDIWSLGVILYELATGTRPFGGGTTVEICAAILREPTPTLPSAMAPLQGIIHRCLEKNPEARYQRADDVAAALETLQRHLREERKALQRERLLTGVSTRRVVAAVALVALVGGIAAVRWWTRPRAPVAIGASGRPAIAIMTFENLAGDEASWLPTGVQRMLLTGLAQSSGLAVISNQRLQEVNRETGGGDFESLDRVAASAVARRAGAGATLAGSIAKSGNAIRIDAQVEDLSTGRVLTATSVTGADVFALVDQLSLRIRESMGVSDGAARPIAEVSSTSLEAYRLYSLGVDAFENFRLEDAHALLEQAVRIDPAFAEAYLQLALTSGPRGQPGRRSAYLQKASEHRARLSEPRRLLLLAEIARGERRYTDAAHALDSLLAKFPDLEAISVMAGQLYLPTGPVPDAERLLGITKRVVEANPSSGIARNNYAYALLYVGRFDDAIRELHTYARLAPREPAPYDSLGDAYLAMGAPEQALESYAHASAIDPQFFPGSRARVMAILGQYDAALRTDGVAPPLKAVMLARGGRYREAQAILAQAVQTADADGSREELAALHLVSAMLAIEVRDYPRALRACHAAEAVMATLSQQLMWFTSALGDLVCGIAELRSGQRTAALRRVESWERRPNLPIAAVESWPHHALRGELALAAGRLDEAADAFAKAQPVRKLFFARRSEAVLSNDLLTRDGLARVAGARGDRAGAIAIYRGLLVYGPEQKWVAMFEPRYALEIGRLLDQAGDRTGARSEYERFLRFWKHSDAGLPETREARLALTRLTVAEVFPGLVENSALASASGVDTHKNSH